MYVNSLNGAIVLRFENYEAFVSVANGTELNRVGVSTDDENYWSKVVYEGEEYYTASKHLTTIADPTDGFSKIDKTVIISDAIGSLNIRNLPSFEGQVIGFVLAGEEIKVIAENKTTGWYMIEFINYTSETETGYISADSKNFE